MEQRIRLGWKYEYGEHLDKGIVSMDLNGKREVLEELYEYIKKFQPKTKMPHYTWEVE